MCGFGSFSEMVENHCYRTKKHVSYHNILLSSRGVTRGRQ